MRPSDLETSEHTTNYAAAEPRFASKVAVVVIPANEHSDQYRFAQATRSSKSASVISSGTDDDDESADATALGDDSHGQAPDDSRITVTSDVNRDPESSPATLGARQKMAEFFKYLGEHESESETDGDERRAVELRKRLDHRLEAAAVPQPSSLIPQTSSPGFFAAFAKARKPSPATVYGKAATPKSTGSLLTTHLKRHSSSAAGPASSRSRSSSRAGSRRRTLQTPVRQVIDDSEDELAL